LAALPAIRAIPDREVFYVADPSAPFPICGNRRQCAHCNREKTWWGRRRQDRARLTAIETRSLPNSLAASLAILPSMSLNPLAPVETHSRPRLLAVTRHGFTFYV